MCIRSIKAGCLCLLLLLANLGLAGAEEQVSSVQADTVVYYTAEGGIYYHLDGECSLVYRNYRESFSKFSYSELFSRHWMLLPCKHCVDLETQTLWVGEKEAREAMPALQAQLEAMGLPLRGLYAWRITPEKDELCVILQDDDRFYEFNLFLTDAGWSVESKE